MLSDAVTLEQSILYVKKPLLEEYYDEYNTAWPVVKVYMDDPPYYSQLGTQLERDWHYSKELSVGNRTFQAS